MTARIPAKSDKDPRLPPMCTPVQDFYTMPHEKLQAMVEHADHHRVIAVGHKLNGAGQAIKKLGDDLKKHMEGVIWSGQAGEAFRRWGHSMANETIRLGDYALKADEWLGHASRDLSRAKAMPKYSPEDKATVDTWLKKQLLPLKEVPPPWMEGLKPESPTDSPTHKEAWDAQERLREKQKAAAGLMKALSESYDHSGTQLLQAVRPNFRPMPDDVMPGRQDPTREEREHLALPGGGSGALPSGGVAGGSPADYAGGISTGGDAGGVQKSTATVGQPSRRPDLDLSGGVEAPHRVPVPQPDRYPVIPSDAGKPQIPVPHVPVPGWPMPDRRSTDPGRRPGGPIPERGARPTPRVPGPGPGAGASRRPDMRVPNFPRDGIVGGRPTPRGPSVPTQNPSRSPVFGAEPSQRQSQPRSPMAPGAGFGGVSTPPTGGSGDAVGRARASEPGGVVGRRPGQSPERGGSTAFTPGGTGLVRGGAAGESRGNSSARRGMMGGFMPPAGVGGVTSERPSGGRRPDYLVEDEETWTQDDKRVVPPVIE